jgi:hypothetical protein
MGRPAGPAAPAHPHPGQARDRTCSRALHQRLGRPTPGLLPLRPALCSGRASWATHRQRQRPEAVRLASTGPRRPSAARGRSSRPSTTWFLARDDLLGSLQRL